MITINLLPVREWKRKEAVRQQVSIYVLSMILLLVILIATGVTFQGKVHMQRTELKNLEQEKQKLAYVKKKINEVKAARKKVEEKFGAIEKLQQGRTKALKILDAVVTALPIDRIWLYHLDFDSSTLNISGLALDNHTVALFMRRLESVKMFGKVILDTTAALTIHSDGKQHNIQDKELEKFIKSISAKHDTPNPFISKMLKLTKFKFSIQITRNHETKHQDGKAL